MSHDDSHCGEQKKKVALSGLGRMWYENVDKDRR
jgi:hypothetical protein